jgi:hypothetical protein
VFFLALVADVTDTPVWFLGSATAVLAAATIALAVFTRRALGQLGVAISELEEVQRDREVAVFSDFGRRWEGEEMTEALHIELEYSAEALRRLFTRAGHDPYRNPFKERRRLREAKRRVVLLRVPNYFEDVAFIAKSRELGARDSPRLSAGPAGVRHAVDGEVCGELEAPDSDRSRHLAVNDETVDRWIHIDRAAERDVDREAATSNDGNCVVRPIKVVPVDVRRRSATLVYLTCFQAFEGLSARHDIELKGRHLRR